MDAPESSSDNSIVDQQPIPDAVSIQGWVDHSGAADGRGFRKEIAAGGQADVYRAPNAQILIKNTKVLVASDGPHLVMLLGKPGDARLTDPSAPRSEIASDITHELLSRWIRGGDDIAGIVRGRFAIIAIDLERGKTLLATDRFGSIPIHFSFENGRISFSDRANNVPTSSAAEIDPQALFRYLYFHCVPAPGTIFRGISRLRPGEKATATRHGAATRFYWTPTFEETDRPFNDLKEEFLGILRSTIRRETEHGGPIGSFLSGGTDSSTVTGLLRETTGQPVRAYSIGFQAEGYDEMAYARTAARHFGAEHRTYYVTPEDLVRSIPEIAAYFDQPFGNSSALPSLYCARLASGDGIRKILAGDGGDELFGGNSRYAKQKVFDLYRHVPGLLRSGLIEPLLLRGALPDLIPPFRKARSYVLQAKVPMPARLETYNLLDRLGTDSLLTNDFLRMIDEKGPASEQAETYARVRDASLLNRMLAYDWHYTLADSDLPKVCGATAMAGIDVSFPLLDDDLLDFSMRLRSDLKLKGMRLRYFFKRALIGFLPQEILQKSKHGFGLPFGVWLVQHEGLQKTAKDALGSLGDRGFIQPEYLPTLERHAHEFPGYYGEIIWILMILEYWLRSHAPSYRLR